MLPSSDLLFSFFNRVIKSLLLGFKNNDDGKKHLPKTSNEVVDNEKGENNVKRVVSAMLRDHYHEMWECAASLDRSLCALREETSRLVLPCAAQRRALQLCYSTHSLEPLNCLHLVTELRECARRHALHEH